MNQWWAVLTVWVILFKNRYMVVVVTDRRKLVARSGKFTMTKIVEIAHTLPRYSRGLGPPLIVG
jgi:hypothetical protein